MTDLERVRDKAYDLELEWVASAIDAHLEEDAERDETFREQHREAHDELVRLRAGMDEKIRHEQTLNNTIARLREEKRRLGGFDKMHISCTQELESVERSLEVARSRERRTTEQILERLDAAYGGDLAEYLGEDWRDVFRNALKETT